VVVEAEVRFESKNPLDGDSGGNLQHFGGGVRSSACRVVGDRRIGSAGSGNWVDGGPGDFLSETEDQGDCIESGEQQ
jgi:hypothetical protein